MSVHATNDERSRDLQDILRQSLQCTLVLPTLHFISQYDMVTAWYAYGDEAFGGRCRPGVQPCHLLLKPIEIGRQDGVQVGKRYLSREHRTGTLEGDEAFGGGRLAGVQPCLPLVHAGQQRGALGLPKRLRLRFPRRPQPRQQDAMLTQRGAIRHHRR